MSFKCGIVGLPNVGVVPVPDIRLENLAKISQSKKIINTTISFVDIAGLVKGASKGEGLGNKFLSHIREVDAIIHMIRCFDSNDIQNVNPTVDPIRDLEIIETEMMLADLESIQKRLEKSNKKNVDEIQLKILEIALDCINNDKDINILKSQFERKQLNQSGLLSLKPKIYVCNVDEQSVQNGNDYTKKFIEKFGEENTIIVSADIENQINELDIIEKKKLYGNDRPKTNWSKFVNPKRLSNFRTRNIFYFWTRGNKSLDNSKKLSRTKSSWRNSLRF
jgi:GTP-binding protein YchF